MAKRPSISTISSGYASTTTLNDNFEALQEAFDNTISRDGSTPNTMSADLDMNGNDIIGASSVLVGGVDYLAQSLAYKNAAETSKVAAEAAKVAAELAYDNFDDRYLGVKTSDPSTDNDGNALLDGALFFDTTLNVMKVYDQGNTSWKRTTPTPTEQANINTVTGISSDVTTVAGNNANVTTVADNITDVNSVATNMAEVLTADTNAATATTKAAEASASATAAANSATSASTSATTASNQATAAATSASNAATSESNASTSASNAASSATSASGSATTATTQASNAASSASAASTSETNAANSATASATSASNSATSESNAATSASNASTSASNAATSASNASTSESNAATSATAAAASYDSFDDRYLGVKATAPSTDNDGDALTTGCLYYNSTVGQLYIWDGSAWDDAALSASGAVTAFNARTGSVTLNSTDVLNASGLLNTGGTMTGALVLNADPSVALGAATKQYVDNEVAGIVDSSPATLDTLNELAAALGDDPNFATTTATNIGTKVSKSGDTMTGGLNITSGNLGVGTSSPSAYGAGYTTVGVNGSTMSGVEGFVGGTLTSYTQTYAAQTLVGTKTATPLVFVTNDTQRMRITSSGSVGIGTSSPSDKLHVQSSGDTKLKVETTGTTAASGHSGLSLNTGNGGYLLQNLTTADSTHGVLRIYDAANSAERMRIDASGSVGIGATSPDVFSRGYTRTVGISSSGSTSLAIQSASDPQYPAIEMGRGSSRQFLISNQAAYSTIGTIENTPLRFLTNGSEAMRIDSSGNLLVGATTYEGSTTSNASSSYHGASGFISANVTNDFGMQVNRTGTDGTLFNFRKDGSDVGSIGTANGYMELGSSDTGIRFYTPSDAVIPANPATNSARDAAIDLGISSQRFKDLYLSGTANAANFNTTSDATLKTNVETLTGSLDAVKSLRGVSFDWIENGGSEIGVIAQEVEAVLPDVVSTNDEGIKSVKYGNMVAVLIEAIKEQQVQIDELKAKLGE